MTAVAERGPVTPPPPPPVGPRVASRVLTALAAAVVLLALVAPDQLGQYTPAALLRLPVEALVGAALLLVLPVRAGRVVALAAGALLGVLTLVRALDIGFMTALARRFDPVFDWTQLGAAGTFLTSSIGPAGATAAAVVLIGLAVAAVVLLALAARRLAGVVVRHRRATARAVPVLAVVWVVCAVLGTQVAPPVPVAARGAAAQLVRTLVQVPTSIADHRAFLDQAAAPDPFAADAAPLGALRGKDVVLVYVESYGRTALEDPASPVGAALDVGADRLASAGFGARSGWLTSPVAGGGSWLAHATLMSGLRVSNQQSYRDLVESDRLTLTGAFRRAGWETTGVMPGVLSEWPESRFWGVDRVHGSDALGNRSREFVDFRTPDQFTLSAFQRLEHGRPGRGPLMAEIPLVTSHYPWTPVPRTVPWYEIGDGTVYDTMPGAPDEAVWADPARIRAAYQESIAYSLESLMSWVQTYGDDDLVVVFLGDHQPSPVVTGPGAGHDVPVTVVARDPAVLDRAAAWGWSTGPAPAAGAPVWPMDDFRDRFLAAFD